MDIDQLLRDDEVHRDVYVSENVFALEMDRILARHGSMLGMILRFLNPVTIGQLVLV